MSAEPIEGRRIALDDGSHLDVRIARPAAPRDPRTAVVYCHGFLSSQGGEKAARFRERALELGLPFLSFDFQGHGGSGGSLLDLTFSRCLDDLARVRREAAALGWDRLVLFGSSMGGAVAMWSAALAPEGIVAGVHIAPALELERRILDGLTDDEIERWRHDGHRGFQHELGPAEVGWGLVEDLQRYPTERLRSLYRVPTLIFQGLLDRSVPWRCAASFIEAAASSAVELHLFADGDHRLLAQRDALWQLTETFLAARGVLAETTSRTAAAQA